jgi:acyl transferase domain-containing protein
MSDQDEQDSGDIEGMGGIAVIGMGVRVPGAADLETFWRNLASGVSSISFFTDEELAAAGVDRELLRDPSYVRARGVPEGVDLFDAGLFGLTPREAETMDPQHRLFLELAWEAFDHAGYDPQSYPGAVGVFAGSNISGYLIHNLVPRAELVKKIGPLQLRIRNDKDFLATLASYKLNLKGPSVNVQTACSTSLVAVCLACQNLLGYQCDMALAGGVSVTAPPRSGYLYQEGVYASDGICRAFDAAAEGTVLGDGCTVVLLKRLEDALADGDTIHAVIRGFATNNDGSLKLDYTAPSIDGQAEVIAMAQAVGDVDPSTIGYVETHGTGTPLGDVIEIAALTQAFAAETDERGFCAIGSVKTNIGHLDAAAGTASLIKATLALRHRQIPPSLHFTRPNPRIDFAATPFFVNTRLAPWEAKGAPRRAAVSSFGVGGTNAHVILEEAPEPAAAAPSRPFQPLLLSAKSVAALDQAAQRLADHLESHPELDLADVCSTLERGRRAFAHRRMLVASSREEAIRLLRGAEPRRILSALSVDVEPGGQPAPAFLFSGVGDQYVGMAGGLYAGEPVFREQVDLCCQLLSPHLGLDLKTVLYPAGQEAGAKGGVDLRRMLGRGEPGEPAKAAGPLDRTALLHPALFVVEYALARLFLSWGIAPQAMIGYSIGEYVAACLAGVFPLASALELVATRARIIDGLPGGAMLAVSLPEAELAPLLHDRLSLAAVNGPAFSVAAGPEEAIAELDRALGERGVVRRRLRAGHAFHSRMMEPALAAFRAAAARLTLSPPAIPFVSNVTGTWITDAQATDPGYWAEHMCRTVRFGDGIETLSRESGRVLLEIGPGNSLTSIALQSSRSPLAFPSLPHAQDGEPDRAFVAGALGRLWLAGVQPDWAAYWAGERRRRVPLPAYPFERKRFWIDPPQPGESAGAAAKSGDAGALGDIGAKRSDPAEWFYVPVWKETRPLAALPGDESGAERPWLVFLDGQGLGLRLAERLRAAGRTVSTVASGARWEDHGEGRYTLAPDSREPYETLLAALAERGGLPGTVLHLWSFAPIEGDVLAPEEHGRWQEEGLLSLVFLAQAWSSRAGQETLRLIAVSSGIYEVTGEEELDPRRSTLLGPCRVIPQEHPAIACLHLDLPALSSASPEVLDRWAGRVLAEAAREVSEPVVALRGRGRWIEEVERSPLPPAEASSLRLREGGVYLITGGLGGIGLTLAEALAERVGAKLVLVSRTALPPRAEWPARATEENDLAELLARLLRLEEKGGGLLVLAADVTRRDQMEEVRRLATERFGAVHGVIHAAGVPPGGLLQLKDATALAAVLAPKLHGTLVLHQVFADAADNDLDFLLLCSSLTALLGAFGLVDHCAANAFLDAFARQAARSGAPVLSVGWDSWLEVGQAARAGVSTRLRALLGEPARERLHPLLDRRAESADGKEVFVTRLAAHEHWVLSEHRIQGQGIVPATAFLEMARAAHAQLAPAAATAGAHGNRDVALTDVLFAQPLLVPDGTEREVRTLLTPSGSGYAFQIVSDVPGGARGGQQQEHVRGWIGLLEPEPAATAAAGEHAGDDRTAELAASLAGSAVEFGPRWTGLLQELRCGAREGWARFALPSEFHADLASFALHPALLDAATGVARVLRAGAYLPFAVRRLRLRAPLPAAVQSRFRLRADDRGESELACDVAIFDADGKPLVELEGYTLRQIPDLAALKPAGGAPVATAGLTVARPAIPAARAAIPEEAFGITPAEGAEAFARLLTRRLEGPQILVSTRDLPALRARFRRRLTRDEFAGHLDLLRAAEPSHPRPRLETPYEAPRTDLEERLARLFQEMLGIDRVGIHDNFFDLGGNSLVATQLLSRLRDELEVDVPMRALFEAPTVAEFARAVVARQAEQVSGEDLAQALAELRQMSREELRAQLASDAEA